MSVAKLASRHRRLAEALGTPRAAARDRIGRPGVPPIAAPFPVHGAARVAVVASGATSRLSTLYQRAPLRILLPDAPDEPIPLAVLLNTAGGLVGGDRLETEIDVGARARLVVTSQAAEKVYRSAGASVVVENRLAVGAQGWLEWIPQETIFFNGCRFKRRMTIEVADDGQILAGEILVFGRIASGERLERGQIHDTWEIRRNGRLVWADGLWLADGIAEVLGHPACFDGALAYGTLVYVGRDAGARVERVRKILGGNGLGAATQLGEVMVARWLSPAPERLRRSFARVWMGLRAGITGLPARLPAIWQV